MMCRYVGSQHENSLPPLALCSRRLGKEFDNFLAWPRRYFEAMNLFSDASNRHKCVIKELCCVTR